MVILLRQAARSIWRGKRSYTACVLLMAVSTMLYILYSLLAGNLTGSMNSMYDTYRFGHGFAAVASMPRSAVERAAAIPGVARMGATLQADARVVRPGSARIITLRLISFDPQEPERLNDFELVEGAQPSGDGVLISDQFAAASGLAVGDVLTLTLSGKEVKPVISGIVRSPEYIYAISGSGQLLPDNEAFGYGYMTANRLGELTGKAGAVTNLSFLLEEGTSFRAVKPLLEDQLTPYGLEALYERADQPSHAMVEMELTSINSFSTSIPLLFVMIAVVILYIMMKRMIEQERSQIGVLKAFGFSSGAILLHYLGYGGITGLMGGVLGLAMGLGASGPMTAMFLTFFNLPNVGSAPGGGIVVSGVLISVLAGLLGSFMGARGILKLGPSEAMRPPAPPPVHRDLIARLPLLRALLASHGFMAVRNISRSRFRSLFVVVGVAFSIALTAFMASYSGMFDAMMLNQFKKVELYNLKIALERPAAYTAAVESAWALEGTRRAEAMLELPAELRHENRKKTVALTAVQESSQLYHLYDSVRSETVPVPPGGVVLSHTLAEELGVGRGDVLAMKTPWHGEEEFPLPVMGIVQSNLGSAAVVRLDSLWALLDIPPTVSALILDSADTAFAKQALLEADNVSAVTDQEESARMTVELLDTYGAMIYLLQLAGVVVAFAIIVNTASISLSERKREYATMRVLGMHPREIGRVVGFEYWALTVLSIPPGIALTRLLKEAMGGMIDNDMFTMPVHTEPSAYLSAAVLCGVAVYLSNRMAGRRIARFDMVEVLKERE